MTRAEQAVAAVNKHHDEHGLMAWGEHCQNLRKLGYSWRELEHVEGIMEFEDGSVTCPDFETAYDDADAYLEANPNDSGPSDEDLVDAAYPWLPGFIGS